MRRGRPSVRGQMKDLIIESLTNSRVPLTTATLCNLISAKLNKKVSWNTVQKYIDELAQANRISAMQLPHSKQENKPGLTVYTLKK